MVQCQVLSIFVRNPQKTGKSRGSNTLCSRAEVKNSDLPETAELFPPHTV